MPGGNSAEPWGYVVPGRPPTPSEGYAQSYARVGPQNSQRTKTFSNGTCMTFGPDDPIDNFHPDSHPCFREQNAEVDMAITDLRIIREPHERKGIRQGGQYLNDNQESFRSEMTADIGDPYDNFRTLELNPNKLTRVVRETGIYDQVPSKYVSCRLTRSVFSSFNKADVPGNGHPGLRDTRFGNSNHPHSGPDRYCHEENSTARHIDRINEREAYRRGGRGARGGYRAGFSERGGRADGQAVGRGGGHWYPRPGRNNGQMDSRNPTDLLLPPAGYGPPMTMHPMMVPVAQAMPWGPIAAMGAHPWYFLQPHALMHPAPSGMPHHWLHPQPLGGVPLLPQSSLAPSISGQRYEQDIHAIPDFQEHGFELQHRANTPNQEPHVNFDQRLGMSNAFRSFPVTPLNPSAEDFRLPDIVAPENSRNHVNYGVVYKSMGVNSNGVRAPAYPATTSDVRVSRSATGKDVHFTKLTTSAGDEPPSQGNSHLEVYLDNLKKSAISRGESFLMGERASAGIGRLDQFNVAVQPPTPNMQPSSLRDANEAKHDLHELSMGRIPLPGGRPEMSEPDLIKAAEGYIYQRNDTASWAKTANSNGQESTVTHLANGAVVEEYYATVQRNVQHAYDGEGSSIAPIGRLSPNSEIPGSRRITPLSLDGMDNRIFGLRPGTVSAPVSTAASRDPSPFRHPGVIGGGRTDRSMWLSKK